MFETALSSKRCRSLDATRLGPDRAQKSGPAAKEVLVCIARCPVHPMGTVERNERMFGGHKRPRQLPHGQDTMGFDSLGIERRGLHAFRHLDQTADESGYAARRISNRKDIDGILSCKESGSRTLTLNS